MNELESILNGVSRTFGLSIPCLPDRLRHEIGTAYLLCRIADTFEDEGTWDPATRVFLLRRFKRAIGSRSCDKPLFDVLQETSDHWGDRYHALLEHAPLILEQYHGLSIDTKQHIRSCLFFMIDGMTQFIMRDWAVDSLEGIETYCYAVAGVVGVMCTNLFVEADPHLAPQQRQLIALSAKYGEGLQLINILRDQDQDQSAHRSFIPRSVSRETLIVRAARGMAAADEYLTLLEISGSDRGVVAFNKLNIRLGHATLNAIQQQGPGAKLDRQQVADIAAATF